MFNFLPISAKSIIKKIWVFGNTITVEYKDNSDVETGPLHQLLGQQLCNGGADITRIREGDIEHKVCSVHPEGLLRLSNHEHYEFNQVITPDILECFFKRILTLQNNIFARENLINTEQGFLYKLNKALQGRKDPIIVDTITSYLPEEEFTRLFLSYDKYYKSNQFLLQTQYNSCVASVQAAECQKSFLCRNEAQITAFQNVVREQSAVVIHTAAFTFVVEVMERLLLSYTGLSLLNIQRIIFALNALLIAATSPTWSPVMLTTGVYVALGSLNLERQAGPTSSISSVLVSIRSASSYSMMALSLLMILATSFAVHRLMEFFLGAKSGARPAKLKTE